MRPIDWIAVTILLLFAAGLRIIGISYGRLDPDYFPSYAPHGMVHEQLPIQPDEFLSVAIPVNMALRNQLNPEFFNYPSFIINTNYVVFQLTGAINELSLTDRDGYSFRAFAGFPLYVIARMYSVFGGMLMLACAYAVSRLVAGRFTALFAGLLVAVSFTLVQHSHYIKPATLSTGWMMLATWACFASLYCKTNGQREHLYILAGVATGLAATTRYNAVAVAMIVVPVGLVLLYRFRTRRMLRCVSLAWLAIPLVFAVASPYVLRDFEHFVNDFSVIVAQYKAPGQVPEYFVVDQWIGLAYMLVFIALFSLGIPAVICLGLSLIPMGQNLPLGYSLRRNNILLYVMLIGLMVLAYALVVLRTIRPGHSDHMLIPILPFIALLSALGANWLLENLRFPKRILVPALGFILIFQPLVLSVQVVRMFTQPDTRHIMLQWIHDNIPAGASFFLNGPYNVPLDESIYPNEPQFVNYASSLPGGQDYDFMVYSDAIAFDVLRSHTIVPSDIVEQQREYLRYLDETYPRVAEIYRPSWTGSEAMMNMAAFWHNPTLILYCLNPARCEGRH